MDFADLGGGASDPGSSGALDFSKLTEGGGTPEGGGFDLAGFFKSLSGGGGGGSMNFMSLLPMLLKGLMGGTQQQLPRPPQQTGFATPQGNPVPQQNPLALLAMQQRNLQSRGIYTGGAVDAATLNALNMSSKGAPGGDTGSSYSPYFGQQLLGAGY
jgi:hypothetical protein